MNSCHGAGGSFDFLRETSRLSLRMLKFYSLILSFHMSPLEPIDLGQNDYWNETTVSILAKNGEKFKH